MQTTGTRTAFTTHTFGERMQPLWGRNHVVQTRAMHFVGGDGTRIVVADEDEFRKSFAEAACSSHSGHLFLRELPTAVAHEQNGKNFKYSFQAFDGRLVDVDDVLVKAYFEVAVGKKFAFNRGFVQRVAHILQWVLIRAFPDTDRIDLVVCGNPTCDDLRFHAPDLVVHFSTLAGLRWSFVRALACELGQPSLGPARKTIGEWDARVAKVCPGQAIVMVGAFEATPCPRCRRYDKNPTPGVIPGCVDCTQGMLKVDLHDLNRKWRLMPLAVLSGRTVNMATEEDWPNLLRRCGIQVREHRPVPVYKPDTRYGAVPAVFTWAVCRGGKLGRPLAWATAEFAKACYEPVFWRRDPAFVDRSVARNEAYADLSSQLPNLWNPVHRIMAAAHEYCGDWRELVVDRVLHCHRQEPQARPNKGQAVGMPSWETLAKFGRLGRHVVILFATGVAPRAGQGSPDSLCLAHHRPVYHTDIQIRFEVFPSGNGCRVLQVCDYNWDGSCCEVASIDGLAPHIFPCDRRTGKAVQIAD